MSFASFPNDFPIDSSRYPEESLSEQSTNFIVQNVAVTASEIITEVYLKTHPELVSQYLYNTSSNTSSNTSRNTSRNTSSNSPSAPKGTPVANVSGLNTVGKTVTVAAGIISVSVASTTMTPSPSIGAVLASGAVVAQVILKK